MHPETKTDKTINIESEKDLALAATRIFLINYNEYFTLVIVCIFGVKNVSLF
tara:strand:- start:27035 stop:27190 length:156 start_codon:yes stop_codon:yes gene_type:complete